MAPRAAAAVCILFAAALSATSAQGQSINFRLVETGISLDGNIRAPLEFASDVPIAGFQFELSLEPLGNGFEGGEALENGFTIVVSQVPLVLAFSFSGDEIAPSPIFKELIGFEFPPDSEGQQFCILTETGVVSDENGEALDFQFVGSNCVTLTLPADPCGFTVLGDINVDNLVNVQDIVIIVTGITNGAGTDGPFPSVCDIVKADFNKDNNVNIQDVSLIVKLIT